MSIPSKLLSSSRNSSRTCRSLFRQTFAVTLVKRSLATSRDQIPPSLLSQSLDTGKQRASPHHESVGPFQLGIGQSTLRQGEKVQKWSELSTGGKVMRTTARTTNLTVILLGAGLSALLIYSLTSELFSKNSPTVLYGEACERIKKSPQVAKYLHGSLTFHNNPPSTIRPRHRNRHVSSQIMVDSTGREHMIMNFYVQGSGSEKAANSSYMDSISAWTKSCTESLSDATLNDSVDWVKSSAQELWESSKSLFRYLSGAPMPPPPLPSSSTSEVSQSPKKMESKAWSFAGMFSSLKGSRGGPVESSSGSGGRIYTEGEVHADLIRNNDGYFVFRYILIDLPNSRSRDSVRVFVERASNVRIDEPVLRWDS